MTMGMMPGPGIGAAGIALWTPADLATPPVMWVNNTSTISTDGSGNCSQWNDLSGYGNNFVSFATANNPGINPSGQSGLRVLTFNGSSQAMKGDTSSLALTNNISQLGIFCVGNPLPSSSYARIVQFSIGGGSSYNSSGRAAIALNSNDFDCAQRRLDSDSAVNALIPYTTQAWHIFASEHNWTAQTVGARMDGGTLTTANTSQRSGSTSATNSWAVNLGGEPYASTGQYISGSIGEIVILGYVAGTSDRQKIEGYLAWHWGIEANLPSGHPYKSAPPYV